MTPTMEELQRMRNIDIMKAQREELADIAGIHIDNTKPAEKRISDYLEQVGNPFLVKSGEYILKLEYADSDKDMNDCMMEYVSKMSQIR